MGDFGGMRVVYKEAGATADRECGRVNEMWVYDCEEYVVARKSALDLEQRILHEQRVSGVVGAQLDAEPRTAGARTLARVTKAEGGHLTLADALNLGFCSKRCVGA